MTASAFGASGLVGVARDRDLAAIVDADACIRWCTPALSTALGAPAGGLEGRALDDLVLGGAPRPVATAIADFTGSLRVIEPIDVWFAVNAHAPRAFRLSLHDRRDDPEVAGVAVVAHDLSTEGIDGRVSALEALILERIAGGDDLGTVLRDVGRFVEWTIPGALATVGVVDPDGVIRHRHAPSLGVDVTAALDEMAPTTPISRRMRAEGALIVAEPVDALDLPSLRALGVGSTWILRLSSPATGEVLGAVVAFVPADLALDATAHSAMRRARSLASVALERSRLEQLISHQQLHDPLTGLPNRALMLDRLARSAERTGRLRGRRTAAIVLDLDDFKLVNDALGHAAGDEIIREVAGMLEEVVESEEDVGRIGGDEFLIVTDVASADEALARAEAIRAVLDGGTSIRHPAVKLSASLGVAVARHPAAAETMIRDADAAMFEAKAGGGNRVAIHDAAARNRTIRRFRFEHALRSGLVRNELEVHYQPIVDIDTLEAFALEALVRWRRPSGELVPPDRFVPIAEEAGLIADIGRLVLREAAAAARDLREAGWSAISVGVNVAARQLDARFAGDLEAILEDVGIGPDAITLELTESTFNRPGAEERVRELARLGVEIAIDDFGTGYSSLDYLRRFPVAGELKLDGGFIADLLGPGPTGSAIVAASIVLGHSLDMRVTAEGVQERAQLDLLRELGCDQVQGFLFSPPVPLDRVPGVLADLGATYQPD